jgi:translation initiation factor 1
VFLHALHVFTLAFVIPYTGDMVDDKAPFHNPFGALSSLRDSLPERPQPEAPPTPANAAAATSASTRTIPRAVVRIERSGRGGKEVTVVEHLALSPREREDWLKALKAALGCGGVLEGDHLVLQGDQRKRLPNLLTSRGVKKVTVA